MDRRGFLKSLFGVAVAAALPAGIEALVESVALPEEVSLYSLEVYGVKVPLRTSNIDEAIKLAREAIHNISWQEVTQAPSYDPECLTVALLEEGYRPEERIITNIGKKLSES